MYFCTLLVLKQLKMSVSFDIFMSKILFYSVFQVQVLRRDWTNRFSEITVIPDGRTDFFEVASKKTSLFRSGTCVLVTASTGWLF